MVKERENLSLFDLTNIVVGGIVGADIYVASAISAGLVGSFSIFVWLIAGVFSIILALVFAYNSFYTPSLADLLAMPHMLSTSFMDS